MTKLEIQAIKALPDEYVVDNLCVMEFKGAVYAIETDLPLIRYKDGQWTDQTSAPKAPTPVN